MLKKYYKYPVSLLIIVSILLLSVILHEVGHYLTALLVFGVDGRIIFFSGDAIGLYIPTGYVGDVVKLMGGCFSGLVIILFLLFKSNILFKAFIIFVSALEFVLGFAEYYLSNIPSDLKECNVITAPFFSLRQL